MNNRRPLYLLAGGREGSTKSTNLIVQEVFREIGNMSPNIAYVGVASGDNRIFYQFISNMIKKAGAFKWFAAVGYSNTRLDVNLILRGNFLPLFLFKNNSEL